MFSTYLVRCQPRASAFLSDSAVTSPPPRQGIVVLHTHLCVAEERISCSANLLRWREAPAIIIFAAVVTAEIRSESPNSRRIPLKELACSLGLDAWPWYS